MLKRTLVILIVTIILRPSAWPQTSTPYTVEAVCEIVQPMKHSLQGRLPLFLWEYPLPLDQKIVAWRQDGRLRKAVDELNKRGIAITPLIGDLGNTEGSLAIARTIQEAGLPLYLLNAFGIHHVYRDGKWVNSLYEHSPTYKGPYPWNAKGELDWKGEQDWPAQTRYDIQPTITMLQAEMRRFKEAGLDVAGVWSDYEGLPGGFNFAYEAAKSEAGRTYYPAEALVSFRKFLSFTADLHAQILSEALVDPVQAVFPRARLGNYGTSIASEDYPSTDGNLFPGVPHGMGRMNVAMPGAYGNAAILKRYYNLDWGVEQADVDNLYFTILLQALSAAGANKQPGQLLLPFVSQYCCDTPPPYRYYTYGLSTDRYRELLRHALLRGSDGFYLFVYGNSGAPDPGRYRIESIEAVRATYDEMLEYRDFLDHGTPLNFEVPAIRTMGAIWSGRRLKDRCLVRAFTMGPNLKRLEMVPFPGKAVALDAPPQGATYLIDRQGHVQRLRSGR